MISVQELIKQYHSGQINVDTDLTEIENIIRKTASSGKRECEYLIVESDYSRIMNNLKELGYSVTAEPHKLNRKISTLTIKW